MSPMNDRRCPNCGSPLPGDALRGLCPKCLALQAEPPGSSDSDPTITPGADERGGRGGTDVIVTLRYFGDYELLEEIARGGMGVVYKARQISLNRLVAVKMILGGALSGGDAIKRFRKEAEAVARLDHPNIVPIYEIGEHQGLQYFSMKLVEGSSLAQRMALFQKSSAAAARLITKIARAVHYAHQRGILHRDLKPGNILLDQKDEPHITDFGLAKTLEEQGDLTVSGAILGTPNYMAPEQARGDAKLIATSADLFSIGAILYEMLAGRPPFQAPTPLEVLRNVVEQEVLPPSSVNTRVDRDLETICLKCLEKDPQKRYGSAEAFAEDLERWMRHEPIQARRSTAAERIVKWVRRKPVIAGLSGAVALALFLGMAAVFWQWREALAAREVAEAKTHSEAKARVQATRATAAEAAARAKAEEALTLMQIQNAEGEFQAGYPSSALASLASALRQNPSNRVAGQRLISALAQRNFALPITSAFESGSDVQWMPDGLAVIGNFASEVQIRSAIDMRLVKSIQHRSIRPDDPTANSIGGLPLTFQSIALSSDGTKLLGAMTDFRPPQEHAVRIWDVNSGRLVAGPLLHTDEIRCAAFSPKGDKILTAADKTARLWDAATGQPLSPPLVHHEGLVSVVAFSPDGQHFATFDGVLHVWTLAEFRRAFAPIRLSSSNTKIEFSPDGTRILTSNGRQWESAQMWDAATGEAVGRPLRHGAMAAVARFSPDGQRVVTAGMGLRLWSVTTAELTAELVRDVPVSYVEFSPDGRQLVSIASAIQIWDVKTGEQLLEPIQEQITPDTAHFSQDAQRLLTVSRGAVKILDVRPGRMNPLELRSFGFLRSARFSHDGKRVATGSADNTAGVWDARTGKLIFDLFRHSDYASYVEFSLDDRKLLILCGSNVRVWDATTGKPLTNPFGHTNRNVSTWVKCAQFSSDGSKVITASEDGTARLWDAATGKPVHAPLDHSFTNHSFMITHPGGTRRPQVQRGWVHSAQFSADGRRIITAWQFGARIWNAETGRLLFEVLPGKYVGWAEFSPDGTAFVTTHSRLAQLWDAETGKPLSEPMEQEANLSPYDFGTAPACFSPDSRLLVIAAGTVARIWDARTGQPLSEPLRHSSKVVSARFSPDGQSVVTASADNMARVWDGVTGVPLNEPLRHAAPVNYAEYSHNGNCLLTVADSAAFVWPVPPTVMHAPSTLADLAEQLASKRITARRTIETVQFFNRTEVQEQLGRLKQEPELAIWLNWVFADRATRTLAPAMPVAVADYIHTRINGLQPPPISLLQFNRDRIEQNLLPEAERLLRVSPTNATLLSRTIRLMLMLNAKVNAASIAPIDLLSRRGVEFGSNHAEAWWARGEVLARAGQFDNALKAMEKARDFQVHDLDFWHSFGEMLEKAGRDSDALAAYSQGIDEAREDSSTGGLRLRRSHLHKRMGRWTEATDDYVLAKGLVKRDPQIPPNLIDLSLFYNFDHKYLQLQDFPAGRKTLGGVEFDARGLVHLFGLRMSAQGTPAPVSITGIRVRQKCQRLHFLHATAWQAQSGEQVGSFVLHYADGQKREIPIVYGEDVRDWFGRGDSKPASRSAIAWSGKDQSGEPVRFFKMSCENPLPEVEVSSIDYLSKMTDAAPFLLAMTVEERPIRLERE